MVKEIEFESKFDGKKIKLKVTGDLWRWKEGKCWSAMCGNALIYIHFSEKGNATHGYCNDSYNAMKYAVMLRKEPIRGKWFMFVKGKLIEDKSWIKYKKEQLLKSMGICEAT